VLPVINALSCAVFIVSSAIAAVPVDTAVRHVSDRMIFFMVQSFQLCPEPMRSPNVDLPQVRQSRALSRQKAMLGITTFMSKAAIDVKGWKVRKVPQSSHRCGLRRTAKMSSL
jgi:hypothetical protein